MKKASTDWDQKEFLKEYNQMDNDFKEVILQLNIGIYNQHGIDILGIQEEMQTDHSDTDEDNLDLNEANYEDNVEEFVKNLERRDSQAGLMKE